MKEKIENQQEKLYETLYAGLLTKEEKNIYMKGLLMKEKGLERLNLENKIVHLQV